MLRAADYRERARASLSGNWGMAVLVCFVGALLGGIQSVIPVTANYQYGEGMSVQIFGINMSLNQLPAEMLGILAVMMSILSIYALAQFVIGGVVELGMCAYFSKRALGENADIKDEFANSIQIVIQALSCFRNASVCQKGQEVFPRGRFVHTKRSIQYFVNFVFDADLLRCKICQNHGTQRISVIIPIFFQPMTFLFCISAKHFRVCGCKWLDGDFFTVKRKFYPVLF